MSHLVAGHDDREAPFERRMPELDRELRNINRLYTELLTAFPDIHFELDYIVIGPQGVCEEAIVTATHLGKWLDFEPTGEKLEWRNAIFFPWDPAARKFKGEMVYTDLVIPGRDAA